MGIENLSAEPTSHFEGPGKKKSRKCGTYFDSLKSYSPQISSSPLIHFFNQFRGNRFGSFERKAQDPVPAKAGQYTEGAAHSK